MKRAVLIKINPNNHKEIIDSLLILYGKNIEINEYKECLKIILEDLTIKEIYDTFNSLRVDLNVYFNFYISSFTDYELEIELIYDSFIKSKTEAYKLKELLAKTQNISNYVKIFDLITNGSGVNKSVVLAMAECDLNVSKASNCLYMHRNTLLYKIDRLFEISGFDLKKFYDVYILVRLIMGT